jgi:hypothetical protein
MLNRIVSVNGKFLGRGEIVFVVTDREKSGIKGERNRIYFEQKM